MDPFSVVRRNLAFGELSDNYNGKMLTMNQNDV